MEREWLAGGVEDNVYRHYKGDLYHLLHLAEHSESDERFVVYQALYGDGRVWVRPAELFFGTVDLGGQAMPRFMKVKAPVPVAS